MAGEHLRHGKILKVLVISNHVNGSSSTFQIMAPGLKTRKNSKQLLVMNVIIELSGLEGTRKESNRVDLTIGLIL